MASTHRPLSLAGVVFLAGAALIGTADAAMADAFWLESNISVNYGCVPGVSCLTDDDPVDLELWGPIPDPGGVSQGYGLVSLDAVYGTTGALLIASADANADYGVWQAVASAEYDLTGLSEPGYRFISAGAQSHDQIMVDAGALNGTSGTFDVSFLLDGIVSTSGSAQAGALVNISWDSSISPDGQQFYTYFGSQSGTLITQAIPIVFGEPFLLSIFMATGAGTIGPCAPGDPCEFGVNFIPRNDVGSGSADFFSTMSLVGMVPRDEFGNPVSGARFLSASGTHYTEEGVVPEPATLVMIGIGGVALGLRRWSRRAR